MTVSQSPLRAFFCRLERDTKFARTSASGLLPDNSQNHVGSVMLVAVLRRGSRATTARECAHLTGSWSKDVHINPSSTIAERALSRVDTNPCSPLPPTRRCRSSSSSAGDKRSGAHERSWAASSIGGSHGASPDPRKITAQLKYAQGARAILANVGKHLEKLNPIHASFALNLLGKDCLLYTSPSPRDGLLSRMPSSA